VLRTQWLHEDLRTVLLSTEITLDKTIDRVVEWEQFCPKSRQNSFKKYNTTKTTDKREFKERSGRNSPSFRNISDEKQKTIKCFKCQELGHFASSCPNGKINCIKHRNSDKRLDEKIVKLNGKKCIALFDTGASHSMIGERALLMFENIKKTVDEIQFEMVNGDTFKSDYSVTLSVEYEIKRLMRSFGYYQNNQIKL
jgi:hypothetical protein